VEAIPWATGKHQLTTTYAWFPAVWARRLSWTAVAAAFDTTWDHVFRAVAMAVQWGLAHRDLTGITAIGIDELARQRGRTAGKSLRAVVSRLNRYVRGWGEYFKRAEVAGLFDRYDRWITRRLRAFVAKRWRNGLWRRYPDQWFWFHLGLTRLYHLRRTFIRELAARCGAGNRPVERSAGNPHATFARGTEASP